MKLRDNDIEFKIITNDHFVLDFNCGNNSINDYLKYSALYDSLEREMGSTTLVLDNLDIVGFCTLSKVFIESIDTESMIIQYLAVSSSKQDTGIGSKIIEYIVEVALTTDERYIFLEALKDDKLELINWYRNRGFIVADTEALENNDVYTIWMYTDLKDDETLNKIFNEP